MSESIFIAMPVFRGTEFVTETVRSIQHQTFEDFHVVMSVDGSDDPTVELCRSFTDDQRFELVVQPERGGWWQNFTWLIQRCDRPFFCYWQQDDLASTGYLAALLRELQADPSAVIAHTDVQWFGSNFHRDSAGHVVGTRLERVLQRIEHIHFAPLRGLIRAEALGTLTSITTDTKRECQREFVFLTELAAAGSFRRVENAMYFKRKHQEATHVSWSGLPAEERRAEWIAMGLGMLRVAMSLTPPELWGRLVGTVLDRLAVPRAGRGFFYEPEQHADGIERFAAEFFEAADAEPDLSHVAPLPVDVEPGNGFERPIHPWVVDALAQESTRRRQICDMASANDGPATHWSIAPGKPGLSLLRSGWSWPEPWGVWTDAQLATISVPHPECLRIELHGAAFAPNGPARVGWSVDGGPIRFVHMSDGTTQTLVIDRPADVQSWRSLQLHLLDAVSPAVVGGSTDERVLGFGLHAVQFFR